MIDYRVGDTRDLTADLPDGSVHLVASSPPFVALRSYLPADHPDKHREIGSEPDPATFLDTLLALTAEWGRVLAPWGSIAIELGDTYSGSAGDNWHKSKDRVHAFNGADSAPSKPNWSNGWPRPKCLALVPQAYALSLAYGRNILTGQPSPAGQWLVRNMVVWHRPNPAVGALGDKYRPSTSYITVATRSSSRWFDLTAVRTASPYAGVKASTVNGLRTDQSSGDTAQTHGERVRYEAPATAPPLDCWFDEHDTWTITTQPSRLAHYAMWPPKLAERLVLSMCPEWVCRVCGQPRRRVEGKSAAYAEARQSTLAALSEGDRSGDWQVVRNSGWNGAGRAAFNDAAFTAPITLGWSSCGHDDYGPGVVLDPFAGTFTTGLVAEFHGRDAIGFDIDPRNAELVEGRRREVRRALNPTEPRVHEGQMSLLGEA